MASGDDEEGEGVDGRFAKHGVSDRQEVRNNQCDCKAGNWVGSWCD